MNNRLLLFYEEDNFEKLKEFIKEKYNVNINNDLYQEINIKIDYFKYKVYILPISISSLNDPDSIEIDINYLNFNENELYGFNIDENEFFANNAFEYFNKFKDEDDYISILDFKELKTSNLIDKKNESKVEKVSEINTEPFKNENNNLVYLVLIGSFSSGKTTFINTLNKILVNNYNEKDMWLPSFSQETTLGIFKISYESNLKYITFEDEQGDKINSNDFPIGKGKKILEQHRVYFNSNRTINIKYPLKDKYKKSIFENLILVDTPGIESSNKTFEKIKSYLNELNPKGYLHVMKLSMIDKSYSKNSDINYSFNSLIKDVLPENEEEYFFDIFLNDDYLSKIFQDSVLETSYNFRNIANLKKIIFMNQRLFPISENIITINLNMDIKFESLNELNNNKIDNYLSEENIIIILLEFIYYKILTIEEYKKLKSKSISLIQKKESELLHIENLLKELRPYSNREFNLVDFLIQINRIFFNDKRDDYEIKVISKKLSKKSINLIIQELDYFLKNIFNKNFDLFEEDNKNKFLPLKEVLEVVKVIKDKFLDYYIELENSITTKYKLIIENLLNNLINLDYTDYPSFNDELNSSFKTNINNDTDFKNIIDKFNKIIKNTTKEYNTIQNQIESLVCKDKIESINNIFYKVDNL